MSLHNLAQHMASQGRNGDSMLMHVTPDEVNGLQSLAMAAGGSLSINPHTGLPEANFFSDLWKTIKPIAAPLAGAALTYFSGGALSPLTAGLMTGGVGTLATGSLKKGLMAGLGAYGGAGLTGGLMNVGADAAAQAATQGAHNSVIAGAPEAAGMINPTEAAKFAAQQGQAAAAGMTPFDKLSGGFSSAMSDPMSALNTIGGGSTLAGAGKLAATALPVMSAMTPEPYKGPEQKPGMIRPAVLTRTQIPESESPRYGSAERRHFNDVWTYPTPYPAGASGGVVAFNEGGLGSLGGYSDGGRLLRGPGDGISDSIPATIGDRQPARLADGEFVVPARIVSEIGNGSTEAGARKLYAMMDRVQKARKKTVGKDRVAANTRAEKYLPA